MSRCHKECRKAVIIPIATRRFGSGIWWCRYGVCGGGVTCKNFDCSYGRSDVFGLLPAVNPVTLFAHRSPEFGAVSAKKTWLWWVESRQMQGYPAPARSFSLLLHLYLRLIKFSMEPGELKSCPHTHMTFDSGKWRMRCKSNHTVVYKVNPEGHT